MIKKNIALVFMMFTVLFLAVALIAPITPVSGASRADCNSRGNADECRQEITDDCGGMSGDQRQTCIERVLRKYPVVGLGASGEVRNCPSGTAQGGNCLTSLPGARAVPAQIETLLRIVFGIAAGVAFIALLIASFNYATASTDMEKVVRSKKAIITSLMGLVIALGAQAIVLTVLEQL